MSRIAGFDRSKLDRYQPSHVTKTNMAASMANRINEDGTKKYSPATGYVAKRTPRTKLDELEKDYWRVEQQTGTGGGGGYTSNPYEAQANALYEQLMSRGDFRYDLQGDMLYRQYADQYSQLGKTAMRDAMGTAAGLTGGYGNSYAEQVGSQAYQGYLGQLNAMVPEFYDRAYNAWLKEGDDLRSRYELALQMAAANGGGGSGSAAATGTFKPNPTAFTDFMATQDPATMKDALQLAGGMTITGMDDYLAGAGGEANNLKSMRDYMEQMRRLMTTK